MDSLLVENKREYLRKLFDDDDTINNNGDEVSERWKAWIYYLMNRSLTMDNHVFKPSHDIISTNGMQIAKRSIMRPIATFVITGIESGFIVDDYEYSEDNVVAVPFNLVKEAISSLTTKRLSSSSIFLDIKIILTTFSQSKLNGEIHLIFPILSVAKKQWCDHIGETDWEFDLYNETEHVLPPLEIEFNMETDIDMFSSDL